MYIVRQNLFTTIIIRFNTVSIICNEMSLVNQRQKQDGKRGTRSLE